MSILTAQDIQQLVIDMIIRGTYPAGEKLPTTRALAQELDVDRNTVAKAYRALADQGWVTISPRRGAFVRIVDDRQGRSRVLSQIRDEIARTCLRSLRLGVSKEELRELITTELDTAYAALRPQAAFVECNHADIEAATLEIANRTGIRLAPVLLADVRSDPDRVAKTYSIIFTSLYHIGELNDLLMPWLPSLSLIAVHMQIDEEALRAFARIPPGSSVGIIVANPEGGQRFVSQISTYASVSTEVLVLPSEAQVQQMAQQVDVIVCSRSQAENVRHLALAPQIIVAPFHVSPESFRRIVDALGDSAPTVGGSKPRTDVRAEEPR